MSALDKYLHHYAEAEVQLLHDLPGSYQQGLLIPVYREPAAVLPRFVAFAERNSRTLLTLVINRPDNDLDTDWSQAFFDQPQQALWQSDNGQLRLYPLDHGSALLVIDRCLSHPPIPAEQGVGLARKIAADLLCALIHRGQIHSPWIFNTDADALLPENYFQAPNQLPPRTAVAVYPFKHIYTDPQCPRLPTLLYEFSLHYYVAGLQWAGSPYAYHSIGSTLSIHYLHYAQVRGFPKRSGAEDFYLLNKAAKTGSIVSLKDPLIHLQARESTRVPFGTGPAVRNLARSEQPLTMPLYHPESFVYLKTFLQWLEHYADSEALINKSPPGIDSDLLQKLTAAQGLEQALAHSSRQGKTRRARQQHLQHWFDGFKTLKLIHLLRDRHLGTVPFEALLKQPQAKLDSALFTPRMLELAEEIKLHQS